MVKVKPCPHIHAGGALVHQAEQARSLNARLRGGRGGNFGTQPVGRVGKRSAARPPGWPGLSQFQQLAEPQKACLP